MAQYRSQYTGQQIDAGITKANTAIQPEDLGELASKDTVNYETEVTNKPTIPTVDVDKNYVDTELAKKQNKITSENKLDYSLLDNTPTIPSEVTESTVAGWGFTKNTGTYSKPNSGIPKTDLAEAVQTSLGKADTALQEHQSLDGLQETLVSGENIKTINNNSILGPGNIDVEGAITELIGTSQNPINLNTITEGTYYISGALQYGAASQAGSSKAYYVITPFVTSTGTSTSYRTIFKLCPGMKYELQLMTIITSNFSNYTYSRKTILDSDDINEITGTLSNLTTTDKTNLVAAINEINSGGGSGTTVVANPTLDGTESHLDGLKVGSTKYSTRPDLSGKVISIMGDSISTYQGWIPDGSDGRNLSHVYWYPKNYVNDVTKTWWYQLIFKEFKAKLGVNESWSGSCIGNNKDNNEEKSGPDTCMASIKRITNLGSNGTPDIIYVYGGTNDIGNPGRSGQTLGTFNSSTNYTTVDLTTSKWTYFVDSFRVMIQRMQYYYPKAKIIVMLPAFSVTYYNRATQDSYLEQMKEICDYFGVEYIDLRDCGITWANSDASRNDKGVSSIGDGFTHPNEYGMDLITEYVKSKTFAMLENDNSENIVYTVTNTLSTLTNTDRYIKGVSAGDSYTATLTGSDLTVGRVSMGGTDITSTAYDSSTGIITISNVTGDIVVSEGEAVITPVTGVSLNAQTKSIMPNDVETLTATIIPANATNKTVTWSVNNNNVTIVPNGLTCQVTGVSNGTSVVTVTTQDGSFTASCTFTIHEIELESIAITTPPSTTAYHYGDTFSKTGMVVTAYYDDETSEVLDDSDYTVSPGGALTDSDTSVTISYTYNGVTKTATQNITVATLSSIAVTTQPTKTTYYVGETFDPTGMVVTATWSDNTTSTVTNYTYSPDTALTINDTTITISCTIGGVTQTTTQAITFNTGTRWYSSNYNANTLSDVTNVSSAGFAYKSGVHDGDGLSMNTVRFVLDTAGTISFGKCSANFNTFTDSETVTVTGNSGDVKEITLSKTYTLSNGEHFFISKRTDSGKFKYTRNASSGDKEFMIKVGTASGVYTGNPCLSVDFGLSS